MNSNTDNFKPNEAEVRITRREFLKRTVLAAAVAIVLVIDKIETRARVNYKRFEKLITPEVKLNPTIRVLDFFNLENDLIDKSINKVFVEDALKEMGVTDPTSRIGLLKAEPKNEDQIKLLSRLLFIEKYKSHGKNVISVIEKFRRILNPKNVFHPITFTSIGNAVRFESVEYDDMRNPTVSATVSEDVIRDLISNSPESIINMSFEIGKFRIIDTIYDRKAKYPNLSNEYHVDFIKNGVNYYKDSNGNSISEEEAKIIERKMKEREIVALRPTERGITLIDGYASEDTYDNLLKLADIARDNPNKMFIVAAGNPFYYNGDKQPDITKDKAKLIKEGLWSDNIIVVGYQANIQGELITQAEYGADIYVLQEDIASIDSEVSSSFATPVVSEIIRELIVRGANTREKILKALNNVTKEVKYNDGIALRDYRLLDLIKVRNLLAA